MKLVIKDAVMMCWLSRNNLSLLTRFPLQTVSVQSIFNTLDSYYISAKMPVTEKCIIPVTGGVEDWKDQLKFVLQTLKKQDGFLRTRWGPCNEDMQRLALIVGTSIYPFDILHRLAH